MAEFIFEVVSLLGVDSREEDSLIEDELVFVETVAGSSFARGEGETLLEPGVIDEDFGPNAGMFENGDAELVLTELEPLLAARGEGEGLLAENAAKPAARGDGEGNFD